MALTKISTGMLKQDAASSDLNIDAGTLYLDVSNNRVGVANTSPTQALDVTGAIQTDTSFRAYDSVNTAYRNVLRYDGGNVRLETGTGSSLSGITMWTAGSERMRIDSSGNVGIGTSSPVNGDMLTVSGNIFVTGKLFNGTSNNSAGIDFSGNYVNLHGYAGIKFYAEAAGIGSMTERMRIDSSGNLLVGKTASGFNTAGFEVASSGRTRFTRDSANVVEVNRTTNDGSLVTFSKDGTLVGSIASKDGDLFIGTDDTTLRFVDASDKIYPANASGNARDNAIDLGNTNARFKDLYLSGTVNAGAAAISSSVAADYVATFENTNSTNGYGVLAKTAHTGTSAFAFGAYADTTALMVVRGDGNVGIGTNSPNHTLEVVKSDTNNTDLAVYNTYPYGSGGLHSARLLLGKIENSTTRQAMSIIEAAPVSNTSSTAGYLRFLTRNSSTVSERMRLDQFGRLNIGNASNFSNAAGDKLQIGNTSGSNGLTIVSSNTTGGSIFFADNNNNDAGKILYDHGSNDLILYTNRTEKLRLDSDGYLFLGHSGHSWGTFHDVAQIGRTGAIANYDDGANQQTIITNNSYYGASGYTAITGDAAASYLNLTAGDVIFYAATTVTAGSAQTFNPTVTIKNSGDVGIGTTSPNAKLEIDASAESQSAPREAIRIAGPNQPYNSNGAQDIKWKFDFAGSSIIRSWRGSSWDTYLSFFTTKSSAGSNNPVERMLISDDGDVRIGFNDAALQRADGQVLSIITPANGGGQGIALKRLDSNTDQVLGELSWSNNTQDGQANIRVKTDGAVNTTDMIFEVNNAGTLVEALRIDGSNNGNVGIGATAPQQTLSVVTGSNSAIPTLGSHGGNFSILKQDGTSSGAYGILMGLDTSGKSWMQVQRTDGTATAYDMLLQPSGGAVRIASSTYLGNSTETLTVVGGGDTACFRTTASSGGTALHLNRSASAGNLLYFTYGAFGPVGSIYTDGSGTTYNTTSDRRLKDNIVDAPSASEDIDAIQVRSFDWKTNGAHQKYGMVAQELVEIAPEAVSGTTDSEEMLGVDYSKLVPMLVKEIQSLRARVLELENK